MNASHWQSELNKFEQQAELLVRSSLQQRMQVLKAIAQLTRFGKTRYGIREGFREILPRAAALRNQLTDVNNRLFDELREQLQQKKCTDSEFRQHLDEFTAYRPDGTNSHHFDDGLNPLINGLFETTVAPDPELDAVMDMIHLEMTPISVILELVDRVGFTEGDTFIDIGSGQGQICLLVHLLTSVPTLGIDIEPAYVERAQRVIHTILGETDAMTFVQKDARFADYQNGTVFFMFTPFVGQIFHQVLERLRAEISTIASNEKSSKQPNQRPLICTYGDITVEVAQLGWLRAQQPEDIHPFRLAIFEVNPDEQ